MNISKVMLVMLIMLLVILLAMFLVVNAGTEDKRRAFMSECQSDGFKHYQCVSLWKGAGLAVFRGREMPPTGMN